MSETNIYEKVATVQAGLRCNKGQFNSFGNYNYRSAEDILEAAKPLLAEHGLVINLSDDIQMIGSRYYVVATATLIDIETGGTICTRGLAREEEVKKGMDGSQITGTASSYARKYALNGLLAIDDCKDADTNAYTRTTTVKCENCGKDIQPFTTPNGSQLLPEEYSGYTKAHYGKRLCRACADKAKAERKAAAQRGGDSDGF